MIRYNIKHLRWNFVANYPLNYFFSLKNGGTYLTEAEKILLISLLDNSINIPFDSYTLQVNSRKTKRKKIRNKEGYLDTIQLIRFVYLLNLMVWMLGNN